MSKKIRRFLSSILVLTMVFTSVCTNCVFAETAENNSAFAEFISREPVATGTAVTYNLQETADCSIDISGEGASREVGGTWVDATNGKFYNIGRPNNGAQVNTGTIIYVPVNGTSDIVINTGYNTGTVKISDVYDYEGDFEYLDEITINQGGWGSDKYEYIGKSTSVVALEITSGSLYITTIEVTSKGVEEDREIKIWEQKDFSLSVNGTKIDVTGAVSGSKNSSVTLSDATATVKEASTLSASVEIPLEGKELTNDLITGLSDNITAEVVDGDIVVTFKDNSVRPYSYTIDVKDSTVLPMTFDEFVANAANVEINKDYVYNVQETAEYSLSIQGAGASQEVNGVWVDATNGKFNNVGRPDNGAQVNTGTIIYVPVKGESTISLATGFNNATVAISDTLGYADEFSVSQAAWGTDSYTYKGKSENVVALEIKTGSLYIQTITVNSIGVQEGEFKTWEQKDFSFKVNGTTVDVKGAESMTTSSAITLSDENAKVVSVGTTDASLKLNLGGNELSDSMITDLSENITASVSKGKIIVTFKNNEIKPYEYVIKVSDYSVTKEPEAGVTYSYAFTKGDVIPQSNTSTNPVDVLVSDDELLTVNGGGKLYWHDGTHGLAVYDGNTFETKVAGNAVITFSLCTYGSGESISATVKDEKGIVSPTSSDIRGAASFEGGKADGESITFSYTGEATTLVFTFNTPGEGYLHAMTVQNLAKATEDNGKIDVWDFGPTALDESKYNNWLNVDFFNNLYDVAAGTVGPTFPTTFTAGDLTWNTSSTNHRHRTTVSGVTCYDSGNSVGSIKGFDCTAEKILGCIYVNGTSGGNFSMNLNADDVVYVYVKFDNAADVLTLTKAGETSPRASVDASMDGTIVKFVIPETGNYTITDSSAAGKARVYRIVRERAKYAKLTGSIDASANLTSDYSIIIRNTETKKEFVAKPENGSYSIDVPVGFTYEFMLRDARGFRISAGNSIGVTNDATEVANNLTIVDVDYHTIKGTFKGFDEAYDLSKAKFYYSPVNADDVLSYGTVDVTIAEDDSYEIQLAENVKYELILEGVNDYEIVTGKNAVGAPIGEVSKTLGDVDEDNLLTATDAAIVLVRSLDSDYKMSDVAIVNADVNSDGNISANDASLILQKVLDNSVQFPVPTTDIVVAAKPTYDITGNFTASDGASLDVSEVTFTRLDDEYTYSATVADGGYSIKLRNGQYKVTPVTTADYSHATHVVVQGGAVNKDIYFVPNSVAKVPYAKDVYVDDVEGDYHYKTVQDALKAVNNMDKTPTSEADRITIHVAPGVYRAQHILTMPYVSLVNTDPTKEVKLTWYYGIGYKYYSAGKDGYYNELNAVDKFLKNGSTNEATADVARWGGGFYIKNTATDFYAENIVFENSFNKYVTEEEIADGVEPNLAQGIRFDRTQAGADVYSKGATERAAAILAEADRAEFYKCSFLSSQDTLYVNPSLNQYYKECFVEGMTDYIFGDGEVVFDNCILNFCGYSDSEAGGYITATKYDKGGQGYLFNNCRVTGSKNEGIIVGAGGFGRPWGSTATVKFINTVIEENGLISERGYTDMSGKPEDANYYEYNTTLADGTAFITTASKKLTEEEANAINMADWFGGDWTPKTYVAE